VFKDVEVNVGKTIAIATGLSGSFFLTEAGTCEQLLPDVANDFTKQINHVLLNKTDLFNFITRSPMLSIFYECKTLCALARLEQRIIGSRQLASPRNGLGKCCFVKNIVVSKGGSECQVVPRIWPASDELEVHIDVVCTCKLKKICAYRHVNL
jgi:hypothetical protein